MNIQESDLIEELFPWLVQALEDPNSVLDSPFQ